MAGVLFGIDVFRIVPLDAAGAALTPVSVEAEEFSFDTESDSEDYSADNRVIDTRRYNKKVSGSATIARHRPAVLAVIGDGEVTTTGTAPNQAITYAELKTIGDKKVNLESMTWGGAGDIIHARALSVRTSSGPGFDASSGSHSGMAFDFEGVGNADGDLWSIASLLGTTAVMPPSGAWTTP